MSSIHSTDDRDSLKINDSGQYASTKPLFCRNSGSGVRWFLLLPGDGPTTGLRTMRPLGVTYETSITKERTEKNVRNQVSYLTSLTNRIDLTSKPYFYQIIYITLLFSSTLPFPFVFLYRKI